LSGRAAFWLIAFLGLCVLAIILDVRRQGPANDTCIDLAKFGEGWNGQPVCFKEVSKVWALPRSVRVRMGRKIANPAGLFNPTDVGGPIDEIFGAADRRMVFAGLSEGYCVLHYEYGGIAHGHMVAIFQLSGHEATPIWVHAGRKYFDLKDFANESDPDELSNEVSGAFL
jgi:hypothetical protein